MNAESASASAARPGTRGPRGPYAKTAVQRERILKSALEFFGQYGYYGLTMRELARHLEMSQAGLLHHFPTKTDLLTAVLEERDLMESTELATADSVIDVVIRIVERNARQRGLVRLFTTLAAEATSDDHPAHGYFRNRYERLSARLANQYRADVESGLVVAEDPVAWARRTLALMAGLQVQWLLDPTVDMVGIFRTALHDSRVSR